MPILFPTFQLVTTLLIPNITNSFKIQNKKYKIIVFVYTRNESLHMLLVMTFMYVLGCQVIIMVVTKLNKHYIQPTGITLCHLSQGGESWLLKNLLNPISSS